MLPRALERAWLDADQALPGHVYLSLPLPLPLRQCSVQLDGSAVAGRGTLVA